MDRNSVIGLLLIGAILIGFSIFNKPSQEEYEQAQKEAQEKKEKQDSIRKTKSRKEVEAQTATLDSNWVAVTDSSGNQVVDSLGNFVYRDTANNLDTTIAQAQKTPDSEPNEEVAKKSESKDYTVTLGNIGKRHVKSDTSKKKTITLENDKIIVQLSNAGGRITTVYLKNYQTYQAYDENPKEIKPLQLFDEKGSHYGLTFPWKEERVNTKDFYFDVINQDESSVIFRLPFGNDQYIDYTYTLKEGQYDLDFDMNFNGLESQIDAEKVLFDTDFQLLQTERLMSEQRRYSTIFYKYEDDGYNYLWENSDDELEAESRLDWIAFKQSYFSSMMMSKEGFGQDSYMEVKKLSSDEYIMNYMAQLDLEIESMDNGSESIQWYFGPNDYEILSSYNNESEDIINYGWGIFRWVNIYMIQPIFNLLTGWGVGIGLAIFLLTLFVKLLLSPITFKMYTSSAKMRVLKPEIQEINEKYPDKEDAMKKQQEMMKLYSQTGVSPLAGCVPMLIQMPILFAVFRFFPSSIDLRQESFLWADDLSAYDSIIELGFNIPLYGDHVSLFTLLMAASTLIYTVYNSSNMTQTSQPGMPNMKIIMYIFPIMMIFFFNNFAAGLSYYYLISNLMSIAIMFSIKKYFVDEAKIRSKIDAKKNDPNRKQKRSKFQERLEMAQKMQQEKKKRKK